MDLQLGLALPTSPPIKSFDLNDFVFESTTIAKKKNNKRSFSQAFDEQNLTPTVAAAAVPRTLPLLLWNNHPNDDGDDDDDLNKRQHDNSGFTLAVKNDGDGLVGWPPIKSWRKENMCFHHNNGGRRTAGNGCGCGCGGAGANHHSTFVKVKMEGVWIARKIDLSLHHSFQTLIDTLLGMFDKCEMEDSSNYKLTYQDRKGDWLIADQDVSWRTFTRSVHRLKLVKSSD